MVIFLLNGGLLTEQLSMEKIIMVVRVKLTFAMAKHRYTYVIFTIFTYDFGHTYDGPYLKCVYIIVVNLVSRRNFEFSKVTCFLRL